MTDNTQQLATQPTTAQQTPEPLPIPPDIKLYLNAVLDEADLLILTEDEREQILQNMYKDFLAFFFTRILESVPEEKMETFMQLDEKRADIKKIEDFLQHDVPNAKEVIEKAYEDFRDLYLDAVAVSEARIEAIAEDATNTTKSALERLAIGQSVDQP